MPVLRDNEGASTYLFTADRDKLAYAWDRLRTYTNYTLPSLASQAQSGNNRLPSTLAIRNAIK